jgi:hypothetical protein
MFRRVVLMFAAAVFLSLSFAQASDLDPKTINIRLPKDIKWTGNPNTGPLTATLMGDPAKAGLYVILTKWTPHHMSRPHFHPNDRYITVISGTWWVGTGTKYDPDNTTPVPAGSFVTHFAKHAHYDGAKDEEVVLEIVGVGPATAVSAGGKK